jgi:sialidase-1
MIPTLLVLLVSDALQGTSTERFQDVFVSKTLDAGQPYEVVRIPALCRTKRGTLLAFAEGRLSISDQSSNVIVLRRREQGRTTWSPIRVVVHDEPASLNNPCVLVANRAIWLMYQRYPQGLNEWTTLPGLDPEKSCRSFVISSMDDGLNWDAPRDLTQIVKGPGIQSNASGPGIGIELQRGPHKGRLVFPCNEGSKGSWSAFAVYSDDEGVTWKRGASAPKPPSLHPNETQFVEMSDGGVRLNARNQASGHFRLSGTSRDGGETWDIVKAEPELPDPVCQGSILRLSFNPNLVAFSNPADTAHRANGTVRLSRDDGETWDKGRLIVAGPFEYSCLCSLPGRKVGVLFETREFSPGGKEGYRIRFTDLEIR